MKTAKLLNGLLWVANVLLGAGIVVFAFDYLLFPAESELLSDVKWADLDDVTRGPDKVKRADVSAMRALPNPVEPQVAADGGAAAAPAGMPGVELIGTFPARNPEDAIAILEVTSRKVQVNAYYGEEILDGDESVPELRGWRLESVTRDSAVLRAGAQTRTLRVKYEPLETAEGGAPRHGPGSGNLKGKAYSKGDYKSRLLSSTANAQTWLIDPNEAEYAAQNLDGIMGEMQLSAYPSGGVKVDGVGAGSIAGSRGLRSGDVVKSINGVAIKNVGEVRKLFDSGQLKRQHRLQIMVQRAGRSVRFEYRLGNR